MKTCSRCNQEKSNENFNKHGSTKDRLSAWCKDCVREYRKLPHVKESFEKSKEKYLNSDKGKQYQKNKNRRLWENNKEKKRAKNTISYLVKTGVMIPANKLICADCKNMAEEYHHPDYTRPKYVIQLCKPCHRKRHNNQ